MLRSSLEFGPNERQASRPQANCVECDGVRLPENEERWQARWIDGGPDERLVFRCSECAEREFDNSGDAALTAPLPRSARRLFRRTSPPPRVSVAVSTYCGEELIGPCIEGLEAQTIAGQLEIIVVDSGSPQNEGAIVERLQRAYSNIVYRRTEHETLYGSWNRALEVATGKYFANVNLDDWIHPAILELFAEALDEHEDADLAYCDWAMTNAPRVSPSAETTTLTCMHPPYAPSLPLFYCYSGCVQFLRRSTVLSLGGYDATLSAAGDLDMLCRLTARVGKSVLVPKVLEGLYFNPDGLSHASGQSRIEQGMIFSRARANTPIEQLYQVDANRAESRASAWTALGNLAIEIRVPWLGGPHRDFEFALQCYEQALAIVPSYEPALHNRYAILFETGRRDEAEASLSSLAPDHAATVRGADLHLVDPAATPRVRGPIFEARDV